MKITNIFILILLALQIAVLIASINNPKDAYLIINFMLMCTIFIINSIESI
jgi:hypothetical protein